jgi:hypothetical protein
MSPLKISTLISLSIPILGSFALANPSHALTLGIYNYETLANRAQANSVDPNVTFSAITGSAANDTGVFATFNTSAPIVGTGNGIANGYNDGVTTLAQGIVANDFYTFSITPSANFTINLNTLTFSIRRGSSGPTTAFLTDGSNNLISTISGGLIATVTSSRSFDVSSPLFDNINSTLVFRIYGANNASTGGPATNRSLEFDNITFDGGVTTAIPFEFESTLGLVMIGGYFAGRKYFKARKNS